MKKFVVLLVLLSMSKVAVAYAADPKPTSRSFVSGSTVQGLSNLNQVLVLLTGKDGKPLLNIDINGSLLDNNEKKVN